MKTLITLFTFFCILTACSQSGKQTPDNHTPDKTFINQDFRDYWFSGKAEISSYELSQARYGKKHQGYALLIFVTEDFLVNKQVKDESGNSGKATTVLKLNRQRKFTTGIYDYAMMTSVFTPLKTNKYPRSLKLTHSSQDWCGHSWYQLNLKNNAYKVSRHSYFEAVADQKKTIPGLLTEDELWTRLRFDPAFVPADTFKIIPSLHHIRLRHVDVKPYKAIGTKAPYKGNHFNKDSLKAYNLKIPEIERNLTIVYNTEFPFRIEGWIEQYPSGFGDKAKPMKTVAKRKNTIKTDYWNKNKPSFRHLRDSLKLDN